jgi:3-phenylpropionate/cinnamic acid dioxygenase small subunit
MLERSEVIMHGARAEPRLQFGLVGPQLQREVEQFLYAEATLLDAYRYDEWLALFDDDLHYCMPIESVVETTAGPAPLNPAGTAAFFDDTKAFLAIRIKRLRTGRAWAEQPPSRTRHLVSNVRVFRREGDSAFEARGAIHVYRSRRARDVDHFLGERIDTLRRANTA